MEIRNLFKKHYVKLTPRQFRIYIICLILTIIQFITLPLSLYPVPIFLIFIGFIVLVELVREYSVADEKNKSPIFVADGVKLPISSIEPYDEIKDTWDGGKISKVGSALYVLDSTINDSDGGDIFAFAKNGLYFKSRRSAVICIGKKKEVTEDELDDEEQRMLKGFKSIEGFIKGHPNYYPGAMILKFDEINTDWIKFYKERFDEKWLEQGDKVVLQIFDSSDLDAELRRLKREKKVLEMENLRLKNSAIAAATAFDYNVKRRAPKKGFRGRTKAPDYIPPAEESQ